MSQSTRPDVCVIGAGPAGAMLAATLAESDHEVLILEAGKRFDPDERVARMETGLRASPRTDIWEMGGPRDAYSVTGAAQYALNERRVKGVGGSTLHWGGTVPRMHPEDFEMASRHGVFEDWPISYEDIEPYYLAAEHRMGAAGAPSPFGGDRSGPFPMDPHPFSYSDRIFEAACDELDIELHSLPRAINSSPFDERSPCAGYGTCNPVCPSGAKYSADVDVRRAEAAGATVIDRAPVQRLEHDQTGQRVDRAVFIHDGDERSISADIFVLAAGAVETPRLLLLSDSEHYPDGLANSSGLVGRRFMEHVAIRVLGRLDQPTRQHLIGFGTSQTQQYYGYDAGPRGSILVTPINTAGPSPLGMALDSGPNLGSLIGGELPDAQAWGDAFVERVRERRRGMLGISAGTELRPDPDNRVSLDRSQTDDHGNPVPSLSFGVDDHALEVLDRAVEVCRDIVAATGAYDIETTFPPERAFFANHQTGTTRMGEDPSRSVVDANLRTHDLENLFVSGGSVFVTGGPANPTLTIAALTLRLANHLDTAVLSG